MKCPYELIKQKINYVNMLACNIWNQATLGHEFSFSGHFGPKVSLRALYKAVLTEVKLMLHENEKTSSLFLCNCENISTFKTMGQLEAKWMGRQTNSGSWQKVKNKYSKKKIDWMRKLFKVKGLNWWWWIKNTFNIQVDASSGNLVGLRRNFTNWDVYS